MSKTRVLAALAAATVLVAGNAAAEENTANMEKCHIVQAGKGMIVAGKADCKTTSHSCAGKNMNGDPDSWIWVPTGMCVKINEGDFSEVPQSVQADIEGTDASGATVE